MCEYSLHHVKTRDAKVGDKLTSTNFIGTLTRGFADPKEPDRAVCIRPGTELAFDKEVQYYDLPGLPTIRLADKVARFTQIDKDKPHQHHDALEFPDGQIVRLTLLVEGQHATVLQLGLDPRMVNTEGQSGRVIHDSLPCDVSPEPEPAAA